MCMDGMGWEGTDKREDWREKSSVSRIVVRSFVRSFVRSLDFGDGDDGRRGFVKSGGAN